jgi:hypothetical protein
VQEEQQSRLSGLSQSTQNMNYIHQCRVDDDNEIEENTSVR